MILFNIIFSAITGWSLGYVLVYYRNYDYQRYYSIFVYILIIYSGYSLEADLIPLFLGLFTCALTSIYTYDPIFDGGHKKIYVPYNIHAK